MERQTFFLSNRTGGLSGPAVRPIAVRLVYETAQAVSIPVIGMGGIATWEDAAEFMLAGATAVSVGMMNFVNPHVTLDVIDGLRAYLIRHRITDIRSLIGAVHER